LNLQIAPDYLPKVLCRINIIKILCVNLVRKKNRKRLRRPRMIISVVFWENPTMKQGFSMAMVQFILIKTRGLIAHSKSSLLLHSVFKVVCSSPSAKSFPMLNSIIKTEHLLPSKTGQVIHWYRRVGPQFIIKSGFWYLVKIITRLLKGRSSCLTRIRSR